MEVFVVLGFLLIPVAGGVAIAIPVLLIAFVINQFLFNYKVATIIVHLTAVAFLSAHFVNAIKGELGRNTAFMVAHVIGAMICFLIYLFVLRIARKARDKSLIRDAQINANQPKVRSLSDIDEKLVMAVIDNDIEYVKQLVKQGANPKSKNDAGYSAEDFARGHGLSDIYDYFKKT